MLEQSLRRGPDMPKPSYAAIDAAPQNRLFMHLFRQVLWLAVTLIQQRQCIRFCCAMSGRHSLRQCTDRSVAT